MPQPSHPPRSSHKLRIAGISLVVLATLAWGGYEWVISSAQNTLHQRLAQRGLSLKYTNQSWSPWKGLSLEGATLSRLPGNEPLVEISALHIDLLWREAWEKKTAVTRWQTSDAKLNLHDTQGVVSLEHFTTDFVLREDKIEVARLDTANGPVVFNLKGQILTASSDPSQPDSGFTLNLRPVRAVLEAVNVKPGTGPLTISGPFALDVRSDVSVWSATLHGAGKQVEWRGLPMQETELDAQLSQAEMKLAANLKLAKGSIHMNLTREGWDQTPLQMSGTLTDSAGKTDEFTATHMGPTGVLTISKLSGDADLFEICRNMPALADDIPTSLKFKAFPNIVAKDLVWRADDKPPAWSLASLQLRESTEVTVMVREHPLEIERVKGKLSYNDKTWHFDDCQGRMLGGSFTLDGYYDGKTLSKAAISLQSLQLAKFKPWVGKVSSSLDDSDLSLTYKGSICNTPARSTGSGTLRLTHAPVVHLPLIDQAYDLFPNLLPHDHRGGTGEFEVAFSMTKGSAAIDPFKARSESVTVTATGTVDLVKRQVSGQARANLRGIAGIATAPLSHVLTEMKVSGPLDDIRVSPITPVSAAKGLITGTFKGASTTVTGSAKLSSNVLRAGLSLPFEALGMFGDAKASE